MAIWATFKIDFLKNKKLNLVLYVLYTKHFIYEANILKHFILINEMKLQGFLFYKENLFSKIEFEISF